MCSSFEITASRNDEALSRKFSLLTRQALNIIEKNRRPRATSPPKNPRRLSNQLFWESTPLKKKKMILVASFGGQNLLIYAAL